MRLIVNRLPKRLQSLFVADGLKGVPSPFRSPWFDEQEEKRRGNKRDFICNVCASPIGSADAPFDPQILEEIRKKTIYYPDFRGEIQFAASPDGRVDKYNVSFYENAGAKRLKWWGKLPFGRPDQRHNYIIGIDPSYGLGSANSAACIYDVNLKEQVGSWVDSSTKPEDFADIVVAMAYWIGGVNDPFLIWESNAGCGQNFGKRIIYQKYFRVYTQKREDSKTRKITTKWGWASNTKAKEAILGDLGVALSGGLSGNKDYLSIIIHEEELLDELADYIFKEKGQGIVISSKADLGTGALERHGDRGIAAALCVLGTKEQMEGNFQEHRKPPVNSFMHRYQTWEEQQEKERRYARKYLY